MNKHLYIVLFLLITTNTFSQKYTPDKIKFEGKEYDYRFHHLEQYFNYYPGSRVVPSKDSTIMNRGYIAFFEIFNDELFLRDIRIPDLKNPNNTISAKEKFTFSDADKVPLRWVNCVIQIGLETDDFSRDSLQPINTKNVVLEIQKGKVVRKLIYGKDEMRIFKNLQWNKYKTTNEYLVIKYKLQKLGLNDIEIDQHIFNNVLYYSKRIFLVK